MKFTEGLAKRICELAAEGKTDKAIAKAIGISLSTFKNWRAAHPDMNAALLDAKDVADQLVEASLFQTAVGFRHPAVKFFCDKGVIFSQRYIEKRPPDVTACIFWLKNRRPDMWRDAKQHEHAGKNGGPIRTEAVTRAETDAAVKAALAATGDDKPEEEY